MRRSSARGGAAAVAWISLALAALALAAAGTRAAGIPRTGAWAPGSWSWFADPRAVHVLAPRDATFAGWISWSGAVQVGAYDAATGETGPHTIGHLFHDDHGNPALLVEPDGRLTAFWSAHNGQSMYYRTTVEPGDISAWGATQRVVSNVSGTRGFTYPNPVLLPGARDQLYLFWRGADWSADYATRSAAGHWSPARRLIVVPGQRPYMKVDGYNGNSIALAFTDGHPRETMTSVYYAAVRGGWLRGAGGRLIARLGRGAISPSRADKIYDAARTHVSSWVWDVAAGTGRHPVVVYATFPSIRNHAYWYARWTGSRWISHFMTFAGPTISPGTIETEYSGGMTLDHNDPSVVYVSRKVRGWFEIERWQTLDGGYHWRHVTVVRTPGADDVRPVVPRGPAGGPIALLYLHGHYGSYTTYRTTIDYLR